MKKLLRNTAVAATLAAALPLAACGSSDDSAGTATTSAGTPSSATAPGSPTSPASTPSAPSTSAAPAGGPSGTITVFAAASLTQSFTAIGRSFEKAHPGTTVKFSFGGSPDLVAQIQNGAPADVFASADEPTMDELGSDAVDRTDFASNTLEIAVPPDNPGDITNLGSLTRPGIKTVVCAAPVPCGAAARKLEEKAGVTLVPVSEEQSVTDVLGKVESGEADAGLVYVTDVKSAGNKVKGITVPEAKKVVNTYPITALKDSKNNALAREFVDYVATGAGQQALADAGFAKP